MLRTRQWRGKMRLRQQLHSIRNRRSGTGLKIQSYAFGYMHIFSVSANKINFFCFRKCPINHIFPRRTSKTYVKQFLTLVRYIVDTAGHFSTPPTTILHAHQLYHVTPPHVTLLRTSCVTKLILTAYQLHSALALLAITTYRTGTTAYLLLIRKLLHAKI